MPKTPPPRQGGSARRPAPTKVSKPFPWGTAIGSAVLGLGLVGILVYAFTNQGTGVSDIVRNPDAAISGVAVADEESLSRNHVAGPVAYEQNPPNGGDHNAVPQSCAVYDTPIAPEKAVHSLEHGAVWITYNDSVSDEDVDRLRELAESDPYGLMSPLPEQKSPVNLSAWGRRLSVDSASDDRVEQFFNAYANGPQTPEKGAACVGDTTTGPLPGTPAAPAPAGSAAASPSATPAG